jgi:hypothetical protein
MTTPAIPAVHVATSPVISPAQTIMKEHNRNALIGSETGMDVMIEDVSDPDGRIYRLEYQSTPDGRHAIAFCRFNPWGSLNGGEEYQVGHVDANGFVCVGKQSVKSVQASPYDIRYVIQRTRFWCAAFSVLKETGQFPNP